MTDEQNTARYTQFGARENKFQAGWVIANLSNNTTQDLGYYGTTNPSQARGTAQTTAAAGEPFHASDIPPVGQVPASDGCPDDAQNYHETQWNCVWASEDLNGELYWAREGVSRGTTVRNDSGDPISNGFGLKHAKDDHNVTSRAIRLLVQGAPYCIPTFQKEWGHDFDRCEFGTNVRADPSGQVVDQIVVVLQTSDGNTGAAPDNAQMGIITAFCRVGQAGSLLEGYCDDSWMGPFGNFGG